MTDICRQIELGRHGSVPEVKTEWQGITPIIYSRTSSLVVYAEVCAPEDLLDNTWNYLQACATTSLGAATLIALATSPSTAIPVFQSAFKTCILTKVGELAKEVKISISSTQKSNGDWIRIRY